MSEQYFTKEPNVASQPQTIHVRFQSKTYPMQTDAGVFSKNAFDAGSALLLNTVIDELEGRVLDLGCGYGAIGLLVAKVRGLELTLVDVNERAVNLARMNAKTLGVDVEVYAQDATNGLPGGLYDWILLNPPIRAGKKVIHSMLEQAREVLSPSGSLALVIQKKQGAQSLEVYLEQMGLFTDIRAKSNGYRVLVSSRKEKERPS